jgi:hypothetical protein
MASTTGVSMADTPAPLPGLALACAPRPGAWPFKDRTPGFASPAAALHRLRKARSAGHPELAAGLLAGSLAGSPAGGKPSPPAASRGQAGCPPPPPVAWEAPERHRPLRTESAAVHRPLQKNGLLRPTPTMVSIFLRSPSMSSFNFMPHPSFQATGAPQLLEPEPATSKIHAERPPNSGRSCCRLPLVAGLQASLYLPSPSLTAAELQGGPSPR